MKLVSTRDAVRGARWALRNPHRAFTLVELLVVITIITVLLALLAPAMDKAIYQAELAVCGARLKSLGLAAAQYASANVRSYPRRNLVELSSAQPSRLLASFANVNVGRQDDRKMLAGYIANDNYLDPLVRKVDLNLVQDDCDLFVGYSIWFGFRFKALNYRGMKKVGDRVEWIPVTDTNKAPRYFRVLASDIDFIRTTSPLTVSGHPDNQWLREGVQLNAPSLIPVGMYRKQTNAWWANSTATMRGPVDYNYAYDDGSVLRLDAVEWNEWDERDRIVRLAEHSGLKNEHPDYNQLPTP